VANLQEICSPHKDPNLAGCPVDQAHPLHANMTDDQPSPCPLSQVYDPLVEAGRQAVLRAFCEAGACGGGEGSACTVSQLGADILNEVVIDPVQWRDR
jgi:hypothetical protein